MARLLDGARTAVGVLEDDARPADATGRRGGAPQVLRAQYRDHTGWSMRLHPDNLRALTDKNPELRPLPSYSTVVRFMKAHDLIRRRTVGPGSVSAPSRPHRLLACEVRSYEAEYTNQLSHSDYHTSKRTPVFRQRSLEIPRLSLRDDDHSRLCCHVQWCLDENAETFAHGLGQAFQERGLPAAFMKDRGGPMAAAEIQDALHRRLGIPHEPMVCTFLDRRGCSASAQSSSGVASGGPNLAPRLVRGLIQAASAALASRPT